MTYWKHLTWVERVILAAFFGGFVWAMYHISILGG